MTDIDTEDIGIVERNGSQYLAGKIEELLAAMRKGNLPRKILWKSIAQAAAIGYYDEERRNSQNSRATGNIPNL
jgi:hypothetical protein